MDLVAAQRRLRGLRRDQAPRTGALGWPPSVFRLAVGKTSWGETHLVLVVRTDKGDLVLDSLDGRIRSWDLSTCNGISSRMAAIRMSGCGSTARADPVVQERGQGRQFWAVALNRLADKQLPRHVECRKFLLDCGCKRRGRFEIEALDQRPVAIAQHGADIGAHRGIGQGERRIGDCRPDGKTSLKLVRS